MKKSEDLQNRVRLEAFLYSEERFLYLDKCIKLVPLIGIAFILSLLVMVLFEYIGLYASLSVWVVLIVMILVLYIPLVYRWSVFNKVLKSGEYTYSTEVCKECIKDRKGFLVSTDDGNTYTFFKFVDKGYTVLTVRYSSRFIRNYVYLEQ